MSAHAWVFLMRKLKLNDITTDVEKGTRRSMGKVRRSQLTASGSVGSRTHATCWLVG